MSKNIEDKKYKRILILTIMLATILLIMLIILFIIKKEQHSKNEQELEIINIFQKEAYFQVYIKLDYDDIDTIENQLRRLENIKSIEFRSKEDALQEMKEKFNDNWLNSYEEKDIFPASFIIKIEINSIDDINEDYFNNIKESISNIDGVKNVSSYIETLVTVYKEKGINGLKEYVKMLYKIKEKKY